MSWANPCSDSTPRARAFHGAGLGESQHGVERGAQARAEIGRNSTWRGWRGRPGAGERPAPARLLSHRDVRKRRRSRPPGSAGCGRSRRRGHRDGSSQGAASPRRPGQAAAMPARAHFFAIPGSPAPDRERASSSRRAAPPQETARAATEIVAKPGQGGQPEVAIERNHDDSAMALRVGVCCRAGSWLSRR